MNPASVVAMLLACAMAPLPAAAQGHETHAPDARGAAHGAQTEPGRRSGAPVLRRDGDRVEIRLIAAVEQLELQRGRLTEVYAYNGSVPGPALELREGDQVRVVFENRLPEATTVHWHGLHLPWEADGSPFHPVPPGGERVYEFTLRPGSAGTYWYHPHPHHHTGAQVARGLYGGFVVRDPDDPLPPLTERLLILSDNRFLADGSLDLPDAHSRQGRIDFENGREGDVLFVNGEELPTLRIRSGEVQRWRVVNASAGRFYRLHLPGHTLLHVGSDGGLFERPVEVDEILLASAERVELLVRGTGSPGSRVTLQSLPYDRYIRQTRPAGWDRPLDLLTLEYTAEPALAAPVLPDRLRRVERIDPAQASATRVMAMTQGFINGKAMDMARVDVSAPLGATEIWQLENLVGMDHPFHLHGFQFQVIDRDGVAEPFPSWKDTVNVPRHSTVRFVVRYDDHPGLWMFHCHILDHEDHGMMGVLEVR